MNCESEAANLWAAMLGLALLIAMTITAGYMFHIYHREVEEYRTHIPDPPTVFEQILDDVLFQ